LVAGGVCTVLWLSGCGTSATDPAYHAVPRHARAEEKPSDDPAEKPEEPVPPTVADTKPEAGNPDEPKRSTPAVVEPVAVADPPPDKPSTTANTGVAADDAQPDYKVLIPDKKFQKERDGALRLTYDDLDLEKILNMKKAVVEAPKLMPEWMKDLDGKKVRLRGYMLPTFEQDGIGRFILCRDTGACCFGPNPTIYYLVEVTMKPGTTTSYIENRPFDVEGTFKIDLQAIPETGEVYKIYELRDAAIVKR
jgi:hypothetical protein